MFKQKNRALITLITLTFLLFLHSPSNQAAQEQLYELIEGSPHTTIPKEGPVVRIRKPKPAKPILPPMEEQFPVPTRKVALTFDDGPDLRYTPQLLDILKAEGITATFFVLGERVEWYPSVIKRIYAEGHLLANHSRTHPDFAEMSNEEIIQLELAPTSKAVEKITGFYPLIIRPPYGSLRQDSVEYLRAEGWQIVRWSLDTFDWDANKNQPKAIINRILEQHHNKAIVLMHCNNKVTVQVLPEVIRTFRRLGYEFVSVTELN